MNLEIKAEYIQGKGWRGVVIAKNGDKILWEDKVDTCRKEQWEALIDAKLRLRQLGGAK